MWEWTGIHRVLVTKVSLSWCPGPVGYPVHSSHYGVAPAPNNTHGFKGSSSSSSFFASVEKGLIIWPYRFCCESLKGSYEHWNKALDPTQTPRSRLGLHLRLCGGSVGPGLGKPLRHEGQGPHVWTTAQQMRSGRLLVCKRAKPHVLLCVLSHPSGGPLQILMRKGLDSIGRKPVEKLMFPHTFQPCLSCSA